jgi:hypothetical protein
MEQSKLPDKVTMPVTEEHLNRALEATKEIRFTNKEDCLVAQAAKEFFGVQFRVCTRYSINCMDASYREENGKIAQLTTQFDNAISDEDYAFVRRQLPIQFELVKRDI